MPSMSQEDNNHRGARPIPNQNKRGQIAPTSLYDVQKLMHQSTEKLIELEGDLTYAQGRLVEAERAWKGHKAVVNLLLAASETRTNEDLREAECLTRYDADGRIGLDLHTEYVSWKSQVETFQTAVSMTQSNANTARKLADTILAAGG